MAMITVPYLVQVIHNIVGLTEHFCGVGKK